MPVPQHLRAVLEASIRQLDVARDHDVDATRHAMTGARVLRRFAANRGMVMRMLDLARATSSKRARFQAPVRELLDTDASVRQSFAGESRELPSFYTEPLRGAWGAMGRLAARCADA
jgi:hypothetical protein